MKTDIGSSYAAKEHTTEQAKIVSLMSGYVLEKASVIFLNWITAKELTEKLQTMIGR